MNDPGRSSAPMVLVHGAWHGAWAWSLVTPLLARAGRPTLAVDIEGHGLAARLPASALGRPFDAGAFATEPSPHAGVTLASAADGLVRQIRSIGRPVVLVGHSLFGHVIGAAAERVPDLVERLVYVCAVMARPGADPAGYVQSAENDGERVGALVVADPGVVGAVRLDVRSPDPDYRAALRAALYGDLPSDVADGVIGLLSTDLPLGIPSGATELTAEGWGSIPRTYVRCANDLAIRPALQSRFIAEADAAFPSSPTRVVDLESSHSPFLSLPGRVADAILTA
jgi:pimeloyl-ACP methyl ester carboxylesterase